ncbi:MAG: hypothetical protein WC529_05630 [Candidatus Margulisiibacteriota bacterium]
MGFHICPFNPMVAKIFAAAPEKLLHTRIPIAQRAEIASRMVRVDLAEAAALVKQSDFRAGFNRYLISGQEKLDDHRPLAALISQLSSVTLGATFRIWCEQRAAGSIFFSIVGSGAPRTYPDRHMEITLQPKDLFLLEMEFSSANSLLWLSYVESQQKGMGGKLMSVLYNTALDLGTARIGFAPSATANAKQFYFHLDFGARREDNSGFWELPLRLPLR